MEEESKEGGEIEVTALPALHAILFCYIFLNNNFE